MKYHITLIEIMIVMFLISVIVGVVAYSYRGAFDEGRAFQSEQHFKKIRELLEFESATSHQHDLAEIVRTWKAILKKSPLVRDLEALIHDGWNGPIKVDLVRVHGIEDLYIHSDAYDAYRQRHPEYVPTGTQAQIEANQRGSSPVLMPGADSPSHPPPATGNPVPTVKPEAAPAPEPEPKPEAQTPSLLSQVLQRLYKELTHIGAGKDIRPSEVK